MPEITNFIFSNLFYRAFVGDFFPQFYFYDIIPWSIIAFSVLGLYFVFKNKKWLFCQFVLGAALWIFYSFSEYRIAIGYERVIFFTSIIISIISAFGIEEIEKRFNIKYIEAAIIILFLALVPFYTQGENWKKFILKNSESGEKFVPMAPANNYLTPDDLRIFKNIKKKIFLSPAWKGTVIGTATDNYPVLTKGGTITMSSDNMVIYQQFMNADCAGKSKIAKQKNIDYIYSKPFSCDNFEKRDESSEGFTLYEFNKGN